MPDARPVCRCHGEPMHRFNDKRYTGGFYWRCRVKRAANWTTYYERMPTTVRAPRALYTRRWCALKRRRERQAKEG